MSSRLYVEVREDSSGISLVLQGELTGPEIARVQHACMSTLHRISEGELPLDIAQVTYIDSLSIGRLIAIDRTAKKQNKRLALCNPQPRVLDALRMLNIDRLITVR